MHDEFGSRMQEEELHWSIEGNMSSKASQSSTMTKSKRIDIEDT